VNKLSEAEIDRALVEAHGWAHKGNAIERTFELPSFPDAILFAAAVGNLAQRLDHHPDILIRYKKVSLTLSTHSAGGLTARDFELAKQIDGITR
jgi:4a-hydroxytetrahydrobiopterin dehydratase